MSQSELERFIGDLTSNPALLAEAKKQPDDAAIIVLARRRGYDFTLAEARALRISRPLSDGDLDRAAGGTSLADLIRKSGPPPPLEL